MHPRARAICVHLCSSVVPLNHEMNEQILINVTPQEVRVAVTEQGAVQELHVERNSSRGLVGNIYLGRVCRVLPGMQSAFVEIGLPRAAFLHVADIWPARNGTGEQRPIEKILNEGQSLLIQVVKDPLGSKGARLSTQVSIAGRLLVYLPQDPHIGISQRIEDEIEREHLREKVHSLIPPGETGGFIVRTVAETATEAELAADIEYLVTLWKQIREAATRAAPQELLYQDLSLAPRVLRDLVTASTERIIVDSRETYARVREFAERYTRQALPILEHYNGERPLFDLFAVEDEIERALARRVDLKSGGYVIIDQGEALTAIDVNTGGFVHGAARSRTRSPRTTSRLRRGRAPAPAAQHRRHHRRRLRRHGQGGQPRRGAGTRSRRRCRATARASP